MQQSVGEYVEIKTGENCRGSDECNTDKATGNGANNQYYEWQRRTKAQCNNEKFQERPVRYGNCACKQRRPRNTHSSNVGALNKSSVEESRRQRANHEVRFYQYHQNAQDIIGIERSTRKTGDSFIAARSIGEFGKSFETVAAFLQRIAIDHCLCKRFNRENVTGKRANRVY